MEKEQGNESRYVLVTVQIARLQHVLEEIDAKIDAVRQTTHWRWGWRAAMVQHTNLLASRVDTEAFMNILTEQLCDLGRN